MEDILSSSMAEHHNDNGLPPENSLFAVEAAQAAKLWAAAAEYTVCECLLCKLLTPHQSTLLLQHVAEITSNMACGYSSVAYRCRYHAALILDDRLNRCVSLAGTG